MEDDFKKTNVSRRHPAASVKEGPLWDFVNKSQMIVAKARQGCDILDITRAIHDQPNVKRMDLLRMDRGRSHKESSSLQSLPSQQTSIPFTEIEIDTYPSFETNPKHSASRSSGKDAWLNNVRERLHLSRQLKAGGSISSPLHASASMIIRSTQSLFTEASIESLPISLRDPDEDKGSFSHLVTSNSNSLMSVSRQHQRQSVSQVQQSFISERSSNVSLQSHNPALLQVPVVIGGVLQRNQPSHDSKHSSLHKSSSSVHSPHSTKIEDHGKGHHKKKDTKAMSKAPKIAFNQMPSSQLSYGSYLALESLDGWFLTVHPKTGLVTMREPEIGWYERGRLPFQRGYIGRGKHVDAPYYIFRLINLANPLDNSPVRQGDPIWLQICEGRGEEGWTTGSILSPYFHRSIELDGAPVNINGKITSTTSHNGGAGADRMNFGLPIQKRATAVPHSINIDHTSSDSNSNEYFAFLENNADDQRKQLQDKMQSILNVGSITLDDVLARREAPKFVNELSGIVDTKVWGGSPQKKRDASVERSSTSPKQKISEDDHKKNSSLSLDEYLNTLKRQAIERSLVNPLDRVGRRMGVVRPSAAHVPYFGSKEDFLYGPITGNNRTGVYFRRDAGYDMLYTLANAKACVLGRWKLNVAQKETTEDGLVIGGLGVEPAKPKGLEAKDSDVQPPAKEETFSSTVTKSHASVPFGDADEDEDARKKRIAETRPFDQKSNRAIIHNLGLICLEQDWFYLSSAPAVPEEGGVVDIDHDETGNNNNLDIEEEVEGDDRDQFDEDEEDEKVSEIVSEASESTSASSKTREAAAAAVAKAKIAAALKVPRGASAALDSHLNIKQAPDGISGGNKRETFLVPHASGVSGPFKTSKKGVLRIRLVTTSEKPTQDSSSSSTDRGTMVTIKARVQLRRTEAQRLGKAAALGTQLDANGKQIDIRAEKGDETAAENLVTNIRQHRITANELTNATYLSHEAQKFANSDSFYSMRVSQVVADDLGRESNELRVFAEGRSRPKWSIKKKKKKNDKSPKRTDSREAMAEESHSHTHDEHTTCMLCQSRDGRPVFEVDLCSPNQEVNKQLEDEDLEKVKASSLIFEEKSVDSNVSGAKKPDSALSQEVRVNEPNTTSFHTADIVSSKEVVIDAVRSSPSSKNDGGVFAHKNADEYDDDFKKEDDYLEVKELMTGANASLRFANDLRAAITQEVAASSGRWNPSNKDVLIPPPLSASQETGFFALKVIGKALNERKAK
jgi:hypothetical protein